MGKDDSKPGKPPRRKRSRCPFCGEKNVETDPRCCACGREMYVPDEFMEDQLLKRRGPSYGVLERFGCLIPAVIFCGLMILISGLMVADYVSRFGDGDYWSYRGMEYALYPAFLGVVILGAALKKELWS